MGFRYYRRVNYGNGWGLNISKSGISSSVRKSWGSIGSKGFSIRTGIRGLSYRSSFGKYGGLIWLFVLLCIGACYIAYYILNAFFYLIGAIFSAIFKEEGINYVNLITFLTVILFCTVLVYFTLPNKNEAKQVQFFKSPTVSQQENKIEKPKKQHTTIIENNKRLPKDTINNGVSFTQVASNHVKDTLINDTISINPVIYKALNSNKLQQSQDTLSTITHKHKNKGWRFWKKNKN